MNTRADIEQYNTPTRNAERATILAMEVPAYKEGPWGVNNERYKIQREKSNARQEQQVINKRFHLEMLAGKIAAYKKGVEEGAEEIRQFAKTHGLDDMLDFCPWDSYSVDPILESDPIGAALKWMHSDHSC